MKVLLIDTLPVQDCKKLLQGEVLYISQKGKSVTKVNYNSRIYLTCNNLPVYTGRDGRAIYDRLEVFHAQPIKKVRADCKRKFRHNCMQVSSLYWSFTSHWSKYFLPMATLYVSSALSYAMFSVCLVYFLCGAQQMSNRMSKVNFC